MRDKKFKVLVHDGARAIYKEYHNKVVEASLFDDEDSRSKDRYILYGTSHIWIMKKDCTIVPNKNLIGGKLI